MPKDAKIKTVDSLWARACSAAASTPVSRNRYVDFLRAVSISAVILGHWLMSTPYIVQDRLQFEHILHIAPWTVWLTWGFQVMPVFFVVGGYANAASWESAQRNGRGYGEWINARLRRLVGPVVPLVIIWVVLAVMAHQVGVNSESVTAGSRIALIPIWFLSVYVMVVVAAPLTHWAWCRAGLATFWILVLCSVAVDVVGLAGGLPVLRWANYAFVWLAVHQLGYFWRTSGFGPPLPTLLWSAGGLAILILLITVAGYPIGMISVPGEEVSNTRPPTIALIALAALQVGLLLCFETPARRWLGRIRPWAVTILVNRSIMTLYLWHMTVMILIVGALQLVGAVDFLTEPGDWLWWVTRPLWLIPLSVVLVILAMILSPFEQAAHKKQARPLPIWLTVGSAVMVCLGLAQLALHGIAAEEWLGVRLWFVMLVLLGVGLLNPPTWFSRYVR